MMKVDLLIVGLMIASSILPEVRGGEERRDEAIKAKLNLAPSPKKKFGPPAIFFLI